MFMLKSDKECEVPRRSSRATSSYVFSFADDNASWSWCIMFLARITRLRVHAYIFLSVLEIFNAFGRVIGGMMV